jgi:hypothetical protein
MVPNKPTGEIKSKFFNFLQTENSSSLYVLKFP